MKLNARWALPVYPVLKDQIHWKMWEHILKKHSTKNSGNDSKKKIAHTYDLTTRTTIVNTKLPQIEKKTRKTL